MNATQNTTPATKSYTVGAYSIVDGLCHVDNIKVEATGHKDAVAKALPIAVEMNNNGSAITRIRCGNCNTKL